MGHQAVKSRPSHILEAHHLSSECLGRKRGFLMSGGEVNTERMARILLDEYRAGKLGRFTLELPEENA